VSANDGQWPLPQSSGFDYDERSRERELFVEKSQQQLTRLLRTIRFQPQKDNAWRVRKPACENELPIIAIEGQNPAILFDCDGKYSWSEACEAHSLIASTS
jgi:hypothetical protein